MYKEKLDEFIKRIEASSCLYKEIAKKHWDNIGKPLDGLGELESIIIKIAGIQEKENMNIDKKAILVMCADNGIVKEGISQAGMQVTKIVSENIAGGLASVNILSDYTNTKVIAIDVGIADEVSKLINKKIAKGTKSFYDEAAMSEEELMKAIFVGIEMVKACKKEGFTLLGTGEMGIGNTTTSAALSSLLLDKPVEVMTGRGAGLSDEAYKRKILIIKEAIKRRNIDKSDILEVLRNFGGFDIAALVGVFLGGAHYHIPVVMDGLITNVAALIACKLNKNCKDYIIASHNSKEVAATYILEELGMKAILQGQFCLGEGTGAALLLPLLEMTLNIYNTNSTFEDIKVKNYERK